ncbi:hypothetical protein Tco_0509926, partial [Tanacetum coccineum]
SLHHIGIGDFGCFESYILMADEQPRGRRGRRGGYARRQPRQGVEVNEEEPRPNRRDQRDPEITS